MKRLFLTGIAALLLATGTAHADPNDIPLHGSHEYEEWSNTDKICFKEEGCKPGEEIKIRRAAHAADYNSCANRYFGRCHDENDKTCHKSSNCCKNAHDWATQIRDKSVCKRKPRK